MVHWLVVEATHLKNMSQIWEFPQVEVKIQTYSSEPPGDKNKQTPFGCMCVKAFPDK